MARKRRSSYAPGGYGATGTGATDTLKILAALGSGAAMDALGGLAALPVAAMGSNEQANKVLKKFQSMAYQPEGAGVESKLQAMGDTLAPVSAAFEAPGSWIMDKTGSPALATVARTLTEAAPDLLGGALGMRMVNKAGRGQVPSNFKQSGMLYGPKAMNLSKKATPVKTGENTWMYEPDTGYTFDKSYLDLTDGKYPRLKSGNLEDMITHPTLFENYPSLKKAKVKIADGMKAKGEFDPTTGTITLNRELDKFEGDPSSTLLHEIQHKIQNLENRAGGANLQSAEGQRSLAAQIPLDEAARIKASPEYIKGVDDIVNARPEGEQKIEAMLRAYDVMGKKLGIDELDKKSVEAYSKPVYNYYRENIGELESSLTESMYKLQKDLVDNMGEDKAKAILQNLSGDEILGGAEAVTGYKFKDQWGSKGDQGRPRGIHGLRPRR